MDAFDFKADEVVLALRDCGPPGCAGEASVRNLLATILRGYAAETQAAKDTGADALDAIAEAGGFNRNEIVRDVARIVKERRIARVVLREIKRGDSDKATIDRWIDRALSVTPDDEWTPSSAWPRDVPPCRRANKEEK